MTCLLYVFFWLCHCTLVYKRSTFCNQFKLMNDTVKIKKIIKILKKIDRPTQNVKFPTWGQHNISFLAYNVQGMMPTLECQEKIKYNLWHTQKRTTFGNLPLYQYWNRVLKRCWDIDQHYLFVLGKSWLPKLSLFYQRMHMF